MIGVVCINKPIGKSSHFAVAVIRRITKIKKVGHTGTLDPLATGVLPVCLGNATKLCDMLTDKKKEYIAEFVLGKVTDTQDISGNVLEEKEVPQTEFFQMDLFTDYEALSKKRQQEEEILEKERRMQQAVLDIKKKLGHQILMIILGMKSHLVIKIMIMMIH